MSRHILAAISHLPQLKGSLRHTAQRLAYYADGTGHVAKSFSYLAADLHVSLSTTKRHIPKLIERGPPGGDIDGLAIVCGLGLVLGCGVVYKGGLYSETGGVASTPWPLVTHPLQQGM